jgi:hypothetical protein
MSKSSQFFIFLIFTAFLIVFTTAWSGGRNEISIMSDQDKLIRKPHNADHDSKFIELLFVVDRELFQKFNRNITKTHEYCKNITKYVNGVRQCGVK